MSETRYPMKRNGIIGLGAAALLALGAAACSKDAEVFKPTLGAGGATFASYVALGNSITAGYQSSGINDSTQRHSYAKLVAQQAGTRYAYASLAGRGCAPPIVNFQTQARFTLPGFPPSTSTTCDLRNASTVNAILNNVAVPNASSYDPTSSSTVFSNPLTTFILGGKSQVSKALDADPTFVSVWIGNNDILSAVLTGTPTQPANSALGSYGVTPPATFKTNYAKMIDSLVAGAPGLKGVLIGVVNGMNAPLAFPGAALLNPTFKAGFDQYVGRSVPVAANCATANSLVSFGLVSFLRAQTTVPAISCSPTASPAVGDYFIIDTTEQRVATATVNEYNAYIHAKADSVGFGYIDPNPLLVALKGTGGISTVPNLASATQPFGACISLDGVHPSSQGHVLLANAVIDAANTKYSLSIPKLPVPTDCHP